MALMKKYKLPFRSGSRPVDPQFTFGNESISIRISALNKVTVPTVSNVGAIDGNQMQTVRTLLTEGSFPGCPHDRLDDGPLAFRMSATTVVTRDGTPKMALCDLEAAEGMAMGFLLGLHGTSWCRRE
jgi:hypothetical protein